MTQDRTMVFQNYYRFAVMNNIGHSIEMRRAIWATLFHCVSTDKDPQHHKCPDGPDSWCFYNKAIATKAPLPSHVGNVRYPLDAAVAKEMVPIYDRLSDENLIQRMQKGKTQNANESLHNVIWGRCPKTVFVGHRKLHGAVASAIAAFNEGAIHTSQVIRRMHIEPTELLNLYVEHTDSIRIHKSKQATSVVAKRKRSAKWGESRRERHRTAEGTAPGYDAYQAGGH